MVTRVINVATATPATPLSALAALAKSTERTVIFSARVGRVVGHCQRFWLDGADLWAEAALDAGADEGPGLHAESVIAMKPGAAPVLCAVILTALARGMIQQAVLGRPFLEAVEAALKAHGLAPSGPSQ